MIFVVASCLVVGVGQAVTNVGNFNGGRSRGVGDDSLGLGKANTEGFVTGLVVEDGGANVGVLESVTPFGATGANVGGPGGGDGVATGIAGVITVGIGEGR